MISEGVKPREGCLFTGDPTRAFRSFFALGTSLTLAAGVGFTPSAWLLFSILLRDRSADFHIVAVGMSLANRIGRRAGGGAAVMGGLILIAIGMKISFSI